MITAERLEQYRRFWSPAAGDERSMIVDPCRWDAETEVHLDLLFRATSCTALRRVLYDRLDIVELGCGIGRLLKPLADMGHFVTGLDFSPQMLAGAREYLAACDSAIPLVQIRDDWTWLVEPESADVVFSLLVLQHVPERSILQAYYREAARVLRPGGVLRCQNLAAPPNPGDVGWHGATYSTLAEWASDVEAAGLQIVERQTGLGHADWHWLTARRPI